MSDRDSQEGESGEESQDDGTVTFLDELKGDDPKIWGYDYYNVIYATAVMLSLVMLFLYTVFDDPELKKMVAIQGCLAVGMLFSALYFRTRLSAVNEEVRLKEKAEKEAK